MTIRVVYMNFRVSVMLCGDSCLACQSHRESDVRDRGAPRKFSTLINQMIAELGGREPTFKLYPDENIVQLCEEIKSSFHYYLQ